MILKEGNNVHAFQSCIKNNKTTEDFKTKIICPKLVNCTKKCLLGRKTNLKTNCQICKCNTAGDIYQEDILLTPKIEQYLLERLENKSDKKVIHSRKKRALTSVLPLWNKYKRGIYNVVPYVVNENIGALGVKAIQEAIEDYNKFTCIRLQKRVGQIHYLNFTDDGIGCITPVGFHENGKVSLSKECWTKGTVIHEILHALGIWHEQSRPDRDRYIKINWYNIPTALHYNFGKFDDFEIDSLNSKYDIKSIMHYSSNAFSRNGRPTIVDRKTNQKLETQKENFSEEDIKQVNALYGCPKYRPSGVTTTVDKDTKHLKSLARCIDSRSFCFQFAIQGSCSDSELFSKNCCASCRIAAKIIKQAALTSSNVCVKNKRSQCTWWKIMGYCNLQPNLMRKFCCKSCRAPKIDWSRVFK